MTKLISVRRAKEEVRRLSLYISLVESYEADTLEKLIIKEYAYTNSIPEVIRILNSRGIEVERQYILDVIKSKPKDELHKIVKTGYMIKTRPNRRR